MALAYSSGSHSSHIIHVGLWISASPDRSTQEQISNPDPSCMSMVTLDTLQSLLTLSSLHGSVWDTPDSSTVTIHYAPGWIARDVSTWTSVQQVTPNLSAGSLFLPALNECVTQAHVSRGSSDSRYTRWSERSPTA